MRAEKTLQYLLIGAKRLQDRGTFANGKPFRKSQKMAIDAYVEHLSRTNLPPEDLLKGFFVLPTGTGKTPLMVAISSEAQEVAREHGDNLKVAYVEPKIPLVHQTKEEIEEWATFVGKADIGIHGDGHRQIGHDTNIYTYPAWVKLTREGKLGAHNVDILNSDEAHHITTEDRIEDIFSKYDGNGTACLAYTATYKYDDEGRKSVERTHKHKIIEREILECIEDHELTVSARVEFYAIRVMPPKEYPSDVEESDYNRALMDEAWVQRMAAIARDRVNEDTGEMLFDYQIAAFARNTYVADRLAEVMNADTILQERMAQARRKLIQDAEPEERQRLRAIKDPTVAVSVHTRDLKWPEINARYDTFESKMSRVLSGDELNKEGYSYLPLKVILDSPHGSLLDKAQIFGRGTRLYGEQGLVFIDCIIYMGHEDPAIDAQNRFEAESRAITADQLLDGETFVKAKDYKPKQPPLPPGPPKPPIKIEGQEVEAYITLEQSKTYASRLKGAREKAGQKVPDGYIEVTENMMAELEAEQKRTGMKGSAISRICPELVLEGVTAGKIDQIYVGNRGWTQAQWILLINCYRNQEALFIITEGMIGELISEQTRTGMKHVAICSACPELEAAGISIHKFSAIGVGNNVWTRFQWTLLMECYRRQPTVSQEPIIIITDSMINELKLEQRRTSMKSWAITKTCPELEIAGITAAKISALVERNVGLWTQSQWNLLMNCYRKQPTVNQEAAITITQEMINYLRLEQQRTGMKSSSICSCYSELAIAGITPNKINSLLRGVGINAWTQSQWNLLMECYRRQLTVSQEPKITVTQSMLDELNAEQQRTGMKDFAICKACPELEFIDVTYPKIKGTRVGNNKWTQSQWNLLMECYRRQPTVSQEPIIIITESMIDEFKAEQRRTGLGAIGICSAFPELELSGITGPKIRAFTKKIGSWTQSQWDLLMACYRRQPDKGQGKLQAQDKVGLSTSLTPLAPTRGETTKGKDRKRGDRER